ILRMETHPDKGDDFELSGGAKGIPRFEVAAMTKISDDGERLAFDPNKDFIHLPGAESKFTIRYDSISNRYWTLANKITNIHSDLDFNISPHRQRNVVSLLSSHNLRDWVEHTRVLQWN